MDNQQLTPTDRQLLAREVAADGFYCDENSTPHSIFCAGWNAAMEWVKQQPEQLGEDYYILAEVRLAADMAITEYGTPTARLHSIADLIDKKQLELKPS